MTGQVFRFCMDLIIYSYFTDAIKTFCNLYLTFEMTVVHYYIFVNNLLNLLTLATSIFILLLVSSFMPFPQHIHNHFYLFVQLMTDFSKF